MIGLSSLIGSIFSFLGSVFGLIFERNRLKNAPEIKQNKVAENEQKEIDNVNKTIKDQKVDEIRKDLSF